MKWPVSVQAVLVCCSMLVVSCAANAQEVIETEFGNVFVTTFKAITDRSNRASCHKLPGVINYKAFQSQDNHNFTAEEYQRLAGDSPFLGLRGYDYWYDRDQRRYVEWSELAGRYGAFQSGQWDDLPVLCGTKNQPAAKPAPRQAMTAQAQKTPTVRQGFHDYTLHEGDGFRVLSYFDSPGAQWCRHIYVTVIAEHERDEVRTSILAQGPAALLEQEIVREIKKICPVFPNAYEHTRQIVTLKFRPAEGGIEDESLNPDKLSFSLDEAGGVSLIRDLAFRNWVERNQGTAAHEALMASIERGESRQQRLNHNERLLGHIKRSLDSVNRSLQLCLNRRDIYLGAFSLSANPDYFAALNLNEDAKLKFDAALQYYLKAEQALQSAQSLSDLFADSAEAQADSHLDEFRQQQARGDAALAEGDEKFLAALKVFAEASGNAAEGVPTE